MSPNAQEYAIEPERYREASRIWRKNNHGKFIAYKRKHREKLNKYTRVYHKHHSHLYKKYHILIRKKAMTIFCKNGIIKCNCCGEKNYLFLSFDHIYNDGSKDREKNGGGGVTFFRHMIKNKKKYKDRIQILCFNCNYGKKRNNGICPHKKIRR